MHDPNEPKTADGQPSDPDTRGTELDPDGHQNPDNQGTGTGDNEQHDR